MVAVCLTSMAIASSARLISHCFSQVGEVCQLCSARLSSLTVIPMTVPMELSRVLILDSSPEQFITLTECDGPRSFAIRIGTHEAVAIERRLRGQTPARPQTHELLSATIRALGGELERIVIHRVENGTYFANLLIRCDGELIEVDARPSDAIALGAANRVPIDVAEAVLLESAQERSEIDPPIEAGEGDDDD
jgi:bifunctional DNase/RNase